MQVLRQLELYGPGSTVTRIHAGPEAETASAGGHQGPEHQAGGHAVKLEVMSVVPAPPRPVKKTPRKKEEKPSALLRAWVCIDPKGKSTVVQTDKMSLSTRLGIQPRDLRLLESQMASQNSVILCREGAIVINMAFVKAIITTTACYLVSPDDEASIRFMGELKSRLATPTKASKAAERLVSTGQGRAPGGKPLPPAPKPDAPGRMTANPQYMTVKPAEVRQVAKAPAELRQGIAEVETSEASSQLPFELQVLEICLDELTCDLDDRASELESNAYPAVDAMAKMPAPSALERVRRVKGSLVRLTKVTETFREVLEALLDDDKDMWNMNLAAKEQQRAAAEEVAAAALEATRTALAAVQEENEMPEGAEAAADVKERQQPAAEAAGATEAAPAPAPRQQAAAHPMMASAFGTTAAQGSALHALHEAAPGADPSSRTPHLLHPPSELTVTPLAGDAPLHSPHPHAQHAHAHGAGGHHEGPVQLWGGARGGTGDAASPQPHAWHMGMSVAVNSREMLPLGRLSRRSLASMRSMRSQGSAASIDSSALSDAYHEEVAVVEMLLEAYFMHIDYVYNRLKTLSEYIQDTEDLVDISLDAQRNRLISVDLVLAGVNSINMMLTGLTGIFTTNLLRGDWGNDPETFTLVVVLGTVVSYCLLFILIGVYLYRGIIRFS